MISWRHWLLSRSRHTPQSVQATYEGNDLNNPRVSKDVGTVMVAVTGNSASLQRRYRHTQWHSVDILSSALLLMMVFLAACSQQATPLFRPSSGVAETSGTTISSATIAGFQRPGTPWQVDWTKLNINLNEEGVFIGEGGEEAGEGRYLLNVPYGVIDDGPAGRMDYFTWQRAYPLQDLPDAGIAAASTQIRAMMSVQAAAELPQWTNIGPAPMRSSAMGKQKIDVSGRTLAIVVDPRDSKVVYVGTALGGVWKSTNGGDSWTPLTDNMPSLAIGALALDPKNPDIIYAGTGEPTLGGDNYYGAGIYKSTNGGQSWSVIGADTFAGMGVSKIIVDPTDSTLIYAASARTGVDGASFPARGIFRSTNGGQSWEALLTCTEPNCFGANDFALAATNPPTLFAGIYGYGIFASNDGGANWQLLTNGLPDRNQVQVQRVMLDASPSNPGVVYASIHVGIPNQYDGAVLFKTTNGGQSWSNVPIGPENFNYCQQQCWYSHEIAVHPTNADTVLLGGQAVYVEGTETLEKVHRIVVRLSGNGQTLTDLSTNISPETTLHPDMHVIAFDPNDSKTIWVGHDGGVFRSIDNGATWQARNNGLATLQFTGFAVNQRNENVIQGGLQDNNKAFTTNGGTDRAWTATDVGDGGFALIDPFNPTIWYGTRFGISFERNDQGPSYLGYWPIVTNGIDRRDNALFYIPIAADSGQQGVFYLGTNRVYRTTDRGNNWSAISPDLSNGQGSVSAIMVAPSDSQTIWAGTSDGNIALSRNGGNNWSDVTGAPLPGRFVSKLAVASGAPQTAYAVYNGFNTHTPNTPGHVFKTSDGGATWQNISSNLPDVPVLSIVLDRLHPGTIFIGTDTGVFKSENDGASWFPFNNGMPNVAVVDLSFNGRGNVLYAATHGRSVFRVVLEEGASAEDRLLYLPVVQQNPKANEPTPTPVPTKTSTPTPTLPPTNTPTATFTPVTPEGTPLPTREAQPTATPSSTPLPTNTPSEGPTAVPTSTPVVNRFRDGFEDPTGGWPIIPANSQNPFCTIDYADSDSDGQSDFYYIQTKADDDFCYSVAPEQAPTNGSYAVSAAKANVNDGSIYGLLFGLDRPTLDGNSQYYIFYVDPDDQTYALAYYNQGDRGYLTGDNTNAFVFDDAIVPGGGVNDLRVRREGGRIDLFVNNLYLTTVNDGTFANNRYVGLVNWRYYTSSPTSASGFDNFAVNAIDVVYEEDYGDVGSGWAVGDIQICQAAYGGGEYRTASQPDYFCWFTAPTYAQPDGRFRATMRREEGIYPIASGVIAGYDDNGPNFYALVVIPDAQSYALLKYVSGEGWYGITWDDVEDSPWLYDSVIRSGTNENELELERDGNLFRLAINGKALGGYIDFDPLSGGYFGLINWASQFEPALVDFDNYRVTTWAEGGSDTNASVVSRANSAQPQNVPQADFESIRRLEQVKKVE